jgi:hypothetical protein
MDLAPSSLFTAGPLLPALPLFFVSLTCLDDYLREGNRRALATCAFAAAALCAVKLLLAVQWLVGAGAAAALARGPNGLRSRRGAVVLALVAAPLVIAMAGPTRATLGFRPFEIPRGSVEKLGRTEWVAGAAALPLSLAGFLGLRLLSGPGLLRDVAFGAGSLRQALALFALAGFPLTLLLRIDPPEAAGPAPGENQAIGFAGFSGIVLWFWTAEALLGISRRGRKWAALAAAGALLALPSTVQHFARRSRLSAGAPFVPAPAVAAAGAARTLSLAGEVFVEPPGRLRPSLIAHVAGRPVVHDGYTGRLLLSVPRTDLDFRRHAVAQFWSSSDPGYGSWFLSRYGVRWIYTPRDALSPAAGARWAVPVFSNEAGTIYRVGGLDDIPLKPPADLPLGTRGAAFFGPGWGSPSSSSPRLRPLRPGTASLYVPLNEAQAFRLTLEIQAPHARGRLSLGTEQAELGDDASRMTLAIPAAEARRGLNRVDLLWDGAEPLLVKAVRLSR